VVVDSVVEFFVSGSCGNNCDPGGISVRLESVTVVNSKKLEAIIDVEENAIEGLFDIEVRSNGRRGRGTELFRVLKKGGGRSDTSDCQIDFSVEFRDGLTDVVISDGLSDSGYMNDVYQYPDRDVDSKDKSGAGTSSGPGFRFDTNGKMQVDTARDRRWLEINPVQVPGSSMHMSGADFRFHLPFGGLDLCSLSVGVPGFVPMTLGFVDDGGQEWVLLYDCIFHDTAPIIDSGKGAGIREKVKVTRNEGGAGGWTKGDTWTITGTDACLITGNNYATATPVLEITNLPADFEMTIKAE